jgi:hypothetical protein
MYYNQIFIASSAAKDFEATTILKFGSLATKADALPSFLKTFFFFLTQQAEGHIFVLELVDSFDGDQPNKIIHGFTYLCVQTEKVFVFVLMVEPKMHKMNFAEMTHDCNWKKAKVRQGSIRTCRRCRD